MKINGQLYGPSPLRKLLAPPGLPPIDHFYCSPLKRWILACKPFEPLGLSFTRSAFWGSNIMPELKLPTHEEARAQWYRIFGVHVYNTDNIFKIHTCGV